MDTQKLLDAVVKGSVTLKSVRKINKTVNGLRALSYAIIGIVLIYNVLSLTATLKNGTNI